MQTIFLSDFHIKEDSDSKAKLLYEILEGDLVDRCGQIILLGDLFDIMVGSKRQYIKRFPTFFSILEALFKKGKTVVFIEGNHDFHLESLFKRWLLDRDLPADNFEYCTTSKNFLSGDKLVHIQHGDLINRSSKIHNFYSKLIRSDFIKTACATMPFFVVQVIAITLDLISTGTEYSEHEVSYFRKDLEVAENQGNWNHECDLIFCGHYHSFEHFNIGKSAIYNTGSFPIQKKIWVLEDGNVKAIDWSLPSTF